MIPNSQKPLAARRVSGFTLIEIIVVLGVSLSMMAVGAKYVVRHADNMANTSAAEHLEIIATGAREYGQSNEAAILSTLSSSPTATVSIAALKAQGYVPASVAVKNNFGQSYSIRFVSNGPSSFEGIVVTQGGETISGLNKRKIAQSIGAAGGYIDAESMTRLEGSYKNWSRPLADFGIGAGEAELAYALFVEEAVDGAAPVSAQYLSRTAVAGMPELNQMQTDLDMDGHNLNGVGVLDAQEIKATKGTVGDLSATDLTVSDGATFNGPFTFKVRDDQGPVVDRFAADRNATIEYRGTAGSVYAGLGSPGMFAVGSDPNLHSTAWRWLELTAGSAKAHGQEIWTTGNFDPNTKADKAHDHSAANITSGVLNTARIPYLDAGKINTGVFNSARIPSLDASKLTTGILDIARIPTLPISKVAGLQGALNDKAPIRSPTFTSGATVGSGYFSINAYSSAYGSGSLETYYDARSASLIIRGRDSSNGAVDAGLTVAGPIYAQGSAVWHAGTFNPDTKQNSLGFTPVRQGGGIGQLGNRVFMGWSGSRVKVTVDATDMGNVVFDSHIQDVVRTSGNQTINGQKIFSDWVRTSGSGGWYSQTYDGGFHMIDANWIRAYNNKGIYTGGEIRSGSLLHSNGSVTAGGDIRANIDVYGRYIRPQQVASCSASCSVNGLVAITSAGALLSCNSGRWDGYACGTTGGGGGGSAGGCPGESPPRAGCSPGSPSGWICTNPRQTYQCR